MKKSLFKNTIYKAMLSFVNIVIPLLIGPYITKLLDIELYGIYNKVYANLQLFLTFATFGVYVYGVKEISKIRNDKEKVSVLLSNLFTVSVITNVIVAGIYIIFSLVSSAGITTKIYMVMLVQFLANICLIEYVNEALENYKFITIKTFIVKIIYMVCLFLFVKHPDDIVIYAIIINCTVLLNNLISFIYAKKRIKISIKKLNLKKYVPSLFMILIITNIDLLYSQLDRVMLGNFVNNVSVTIYYIPYYIVSTLVSIPYSIINVSIPRLSFLLENDGKKNYEESLNKAISALMFIIIPMCFGVFVLAKEIITLYAGNKYDAIIPVLMLACIVRIIISIESTLIHLVMYPNNKEKKIVQFTLITGILNVILNTALLIFKIFTPFTAMLTTGISELVLVIILYYYAKTKMKINYRLLTKTNIKYLVLGLSFIPISYLIRYFNLSFWINIVLTIIICSLIYIIILYGCKDENLILIINKIKNILNNLKKLMQKVKIRRKK